jgi:hypothetical protein
MVGLDGEQIAMSSLIQTIWSNAADAPTRTLHWFMALKQEEWLVTLLVVCALGFLCMLGFGGKRV